MASERYRGRVEQVVRALMRCGGRAKHNAEFLQLELQKDDRALVRWLTSPFGLAVWAEAVGALHERLESDPRNSVLAAGVRCAEEVEGEVRAELRQIVRERRNATPPPALAKASPFRVIRGGAAPRDMAPTVPPPGGRAA